MKQLPVTYTIVLVIVAITSNALTACLVFRLADLPGLLLSFINSGEKYVHIMQIFLMFKPGNYKSHIWLFIVYSQAVKESQKLA